MSLDDNRDIYYDGHHRARAPLRAINAAVAVAVAARRRRKDAAIFVVAISRRWMEASIQLEQQIHRLISNIPWPWHRAVDRANHEIRLPPSVLQQRGVRNKRHVARGPLYRHTIESWTSLSSCDVSHSPLIPLWTTAARIRSLTRKIYSPHFPLPVSRVLCRWKSLSSKPPAPSFGPICTPRLTGGAGG
jgi:hypothetical protein